MVLNRPVSLGRTRHPPKRVMYDDLRVVKADRRPVYSLHNPSTHSSKVAVFTAVREAGVYR